MTGSPTRREGGPDGVDLMNLQYVLTILSLVTATLILLLGIVLVTGWYLPPQVPENYRLTLGILMTLYAIYRIWMIRSRSRKKSDDHASE